jgi:hypothetical protein
VRACAHERNQESACVGMWRVPPWGAFRPCPSVRCLSFYLGADVRATCLCFLAAPLLPGSPAARQGPWRRYQPPAAAARTSPLRCLSVCLSVCLGLLYLCLTLCLLPPPRTRMHNPAGQPGAPAYTLRPVQAAAPTLAGRATRTRSCRLCDAMRRDVRAASTGMAPRQGCATRSCCKTLRAR